MNKQNKYQRDFYKQVNDLSLYYRIQLPYEEVLNLAEATGGYNEFDHMKLRAMLDAFDKLIPTQYYNENNPNNGRRLYELEIGREGSMVVYLSISNYGSGGKQKEAIKTIIDNEKEFENIATKIGKADEFSIEHETAKDAFEYEKLQMRIWWD